MDEYRRGDVVILLAFKGERLTRRVWRDPGGPGVAICSEGAYQAAANGGPEPRCVGWPREDVLELVSREP
jgi:hypothetical protein